MTQAHNNRLMYDVTYAPPMPMQQYSVVWADKSEGIESVHYTFVWAHDEDQAVALVRAAVKGFTDFSAYQVINTAILLGAEEMAHDARS